MNSMRTLLLTAFASLAIVGCTKHDDFTNELFDCECGTMQVNGRDLNVRMAEGFNPDSTDSNLWRYHLVADFRHEEEAINHAPSEDLSITVDLIYSGSSFTANATDVLTANYIAIPVDEMWDVTSGTVEINAGDSLHTLTLNDVAVDGDKTLNGEFTIVPQ